MLKKVALFVFSTWVAATAWGQTQPEGAGDGQLLSPGTPFFVPHPYLTIQGGGGVDVGEADYSWKFIQPAVEAELNLLPLFAGKDPGQHRGFPSEARLPVAFQTLVLSVPRAA